MLLALSIRDFAIVEELELEFGAGFTVLTGETGAGKSILIDALQFALGERTPADSVREGAARAEVAAQFAGSAACARWLEEGGFDAGEAGGAMHPMVLVRRTLDTQGRSRAYVNGGAATLAQLRELGALLLDVHGQHEHQLLLRPAAQLDLLDRSGHLAAQAAQVAQAHAQWRAAAQVLQQAQALQAHSVAQVAQLRAQAEELEALAPEEGEWERIEAEQRRLAHGGALLEGARQAVEAIAESEDALQGRLARLHTRLSALSQYDAALVPVLAALAGADIQLEEAARALNHYLAGCEVDEGRRAQIEERIAALHSAGRKWRCPPAQLPALLASTLEQLARLQAAQDLEGLQQASAQAESAYRTQAQALSAGRAHAAARLSVEVSRAMQDLAMKGGRLELRLAPAEPGAHGLEKVEFLVRAHATGGARPLAKVASGGELSRIGLAIAVVAAADNLVPTLIFDEVDAGVGGQVAATVGQLLNRLGRSRQVLCVTHLPQVASFADRHYAVRKAARPDGSPVSRTEALDGDPRVEEIARMLGGAQLTALTRQHAREMLAQRA